MTSYDRPDLLAALTAERFQLTAEEYPMTDLDPPALCGDQYGRHGGRQRGDRIVECDRPAGHDGLHEESATWSTWPDHAPGSPDASPAADETAVA